MQPTFNEAIGLINDARKKMSKEEIVYLADGVSRSTIDRALNGKSITLKKQAKIIELAIKLTAKETNSTKNSLQNDFFVSAVFSNFGVPMGGCTADLTAIMGKFVAIREPWIADPNKYYACGTIDITRHDSGMVYFQEKIQFNDEEIHLVEGPVLIHNGNIVVLGRGGINEYYAPKIVSYTMTMPECKAGNTVSYMLGTIYAIVGAPTVGQRGSKYHEAYLSYAFRHKKEIDQLRGYCEKKMVEDIIEEEFKYSFGR